MKLAFTTALLFLALPLHAKLPQHVPNAVKEKYAYLYRQTVKTLPDGSQTFDQGHLYRRHGVRVLFVKGDRFEMAFQHGKLLQADVRAGALPQAGEMFDHNVHNGMPKIPLITPLIVNYFRNKYPVAIMESALASPGLDTQAMREEAYGLAESTGIDLETILLASVGPESLQVLAGERIGGAYERHLGALAGAASQCSAFAAWGEATADGELVIGRNTDYPLNGFYDRFPTVIYYEPTDGSQRFMAVTSAGLHSAGVVGYNESGLYLGVHTIPTVAVSTTGVPAFVAAQEVLRTARTFDEAVAAFKQIKTAAGWTYLLVSAREKKAASIELSFNGARVFPATGFTHVQTNHYRTPEMAPTYLHMNVVVDEDTLGRMGRVKQLLGENYGNIDVSTAMKILGDKFDLQENKVRGVGNVVAVHTTMTSAVFRPAEARVYVASGTAPVSTSSYVELPLVGSTDADAFGAFEGAVLKNVNYADQYPRQSAAEQVFIRAKIEFETKLDAPRSYALMKEAIALDPTNPAYDFVAGIIALKTGDHAAAAGHFGRITAGTSPHYLRLGHYYLGRIFSDARREAEAQRHYDAAAAGIDSAYEWKLLAAIEDAREKTRRLRPYRINADMLTLLMQQADMAEY